MEFGERLQSALAEQHPPAQVDIGEMILGDVTENRVGEAQDGGLGRIGLVRFERDVDHGEGWTTPGRHDLSREEGAPGRGVDLRGGVCPVAGLHALLSYSFACWAALLT